MANCAIDIGNLATSSTDDVMVIVAHAALVESGRTNWLNASNNTVFGKNGERVVHRLTRDCSDIDLCLFGDDISCAVRQSGYRTQHSHSLSGDMETMCAKNCGDIQMHGGSVTDSGLNSSFD